MARKVAGLIRAWAAKRERVHAPPLLVVRFCGGCNPCLDRGALAGMLRNDLSAGFKWAAADEEADLLLILNGCLTACAARPEILSKAAENLVISGASVYEIERRP